MIRRPSPYARESYTAFGVWKLGFRLSLSVFAFDREAVAA